MKAAFEEIAPHEKGFSKHFNEKIAPLLDQIEKDRKETWRVFRIRALNASIALAIGLTAFISVVRVNTFPEGYTLSDPAFIGVTSIFIMILAILCYWLMIPLLQYRKGYKAKILPVICEFFGELSYKEKNGTIPKKILRSGVYPQHSKAESEDYIMGNYKNIKLEINELRLTRQSGRRRYNVFKGVSIIIDFPKKFKGRTLVTKTKNRLSDKIRSQKDMEIIELEDPKFKSIFKVQSTDQTESRYLLTTALMERLIKLSESMNGVGSKTVSALFEDKQLILAVPRHTNLFEPNSAMQSAYNLNDIHTFLAQMNEIFLLIDLLKLDRS